MVAIKRLIANIYVYIRMMRLRLFYKGNNNKSVLVIIDGLIGDTILIQDFVKECHKFFCVENNYSVDLFVSKKVVASFLNDCCDTFSMNVLPFNFKKKNTELLDLISVLRKFKDKEYEIILNPHPKHKGDKLVGCLKANKKYAVRSDLHIEGKPFNNLFRKLAYTDTTEVSVEEMEFERYKKLLSMAGDNGYRTSSPVLKKGDCDIPVSGKYCVFACGASEPGKKWEIEKYRTVANHVRKEVGLPIVFVGGKEDDIDARQIMESMEDSSGCLNLTGKTSFSQWVEVIRKAQFIIGNDSASVHIAAATSTRSICIVGKWQYKRFYPYKLDNKNNYCPVPVFCNETLPCENCGKVIEIMPNTNCKKTVSTLESYDCVKAIQIIQVEAEINEIRLAGEENEE